MKAKSFAHKNKSKKQRFKKQFLGTDIRTVTQLVELKCSTRRKLQIAKQLQDYAEKVVTSEEDMLYNEGIGNTARIEVAKLALNDWKKAVKDIKSEIRAENIEKSKVHTPFANLLK